MTDCDFSELVYCGEIVVKVKKFLEHGCGCSRGVNGGYTALNNFRRKLYCPI